MTRTDAENLVRSILRKNIGDSVAELPLDTLWDDLGDELDQIEAIIELEKALNISLPDATTMTWQTLEHAVAHLTHLPIQVVAGCLRNEQGDPLVGTRTGAYAGCWEMPGGKVEHYESKKDALVRELREELGLDVVVGDELCTTPVLLTPSGLAFQVTLFAITSAGTPQCGPDHQTLAYLSVPLLRSLPVTQMTPSLPYFLDALEGK